MEPLGCPPWAQCQCCSAAGVAPKSRLRILRMTAQLRPECRVPLASAPCAEVSWARWEAVKARIDAGEIILMDGGTGTEVERRVKELGDPTAVDVIGWSAVQALLHPEMCETVHTDYLGVGAEVLIANTYASNRMILNATGFGEKVAETNAQACEAASAARTKAGSDDTLVVGSISCHPPHVKSEDEGGASETGGWPSEAEQSAAFLEQAQMLAAGGVDALFIEMITGKDRGLRCVEAACKVGLPVFVGLVCSRDRNAANILEKPAALSEGTAVEEVVPAMLALDGADNIAGFHVHHTKVYATAHACRAVRSAGWTGPLGAYPDHGTFEMPHWQFDDLTGEQLLEAAREWVETAGVSMVGGCCGIGPTHIQALTALCDESKQRMAAP